MDSLTGASCSKKWKHDAASNLEADAEPQTLPTDKRSLAKLKVKMDRKELENNLRRDPFSLLPEVAILDYLAKYLDTKDKINVCRASPTAKKFFGTKNATWLLSDALDVPHVFKTLCNLTENAGKNWHNTVNINLIKNLREVCRDWRWSVDNYYNTAYGKLPTYSKYTSLLSLSPERYDDKWDTYYDAEDEEELGKPYFFMSSHKFPIQEFLNRVKSNERCPFITKSIHVYLRPGAMVKKEKGVTFPGGNAWESPGVATLLDMYGKDILCAEVSQWAPSLTTETVNQLRKVLYRMPNLVYLHFKNDTDDEENATLNPRSPPFPPLRNLKVLVIYNRARIRNTTLRFLPLMKNFFEQIHTLIVTRTALLEWYDPEKDSKFPNLQRLSILVEGQEQLLKLRGWTSPLKEVKIRSTLHGTLDLYLHGLEKFWGTLIALLIEVVSQDDEKPVGIEDLNLPIPNVFALPQLQILMCYGLKEEDSNDVLSKLSNQPSFCKFV